MGGCESRKVQPQEQIQTEIAPEPLEIILAPKKDYVAGEQPNNLKLFSLEHHKEKQTIRSAVPSNETKNKNQDIKNTIGQYKEVLKHESVKTKTNHHYNKPSGNFQIVPETSIVEKVHINQKQRVMCMSKQKQYEIKIWAKQGLVLYRKYNWNLTHEYIKTEQSFISEPVSAALVTFPSLSSIKIQ